MKTTGVIVLSGGGSTRMGSPKQLLNVHGQTLLKRLLYNIEGIPFTCRVVVLGSAAKSILSTLLPIGFHTVLNEQWNDGMGSSIRCGMEGLLNTCTPNQVLFLVSDQPYVSGDLINTMLSTSESSDKGIIACTYAGTVGVPVLFSSAYFSSLLELNDHWGAKVLLKRFAEDIAKVPFPLGHVDLDTPEDYAAYLQGDLAHFDRKMD